MRFARRDERDLIVSYKYDHGPSYQCLGEAVGSNNRLSRDFRRRLIFDFLQQHLP
jgi:hypothetical protein